MQVFQYSQPIDSDQLRVRFAKVLAGRELKLSPTTENLLFRQLTELGACLDEGLICPFPLISSVKSAHNHAKKIKRAFGESGPMLYKCQQVLADFYCFETWILFKAAVERFVENPNSMNQSFTNTKKRGRSQGLEAVIRKIPNYKATGGGSEDSTTVSCRPAKFDVNRLRVAGITRQIEMDGHQVIIQEFAAGHKTPAMTHRYAEKDKQVGRSEKE